MPDGPAAPAGWEATGFNGAVGDTGDCKDGWNAFAYSSNKGKLFATMKGSGRATVKYKDCLKGGFVGLYVNDVQKDHTETETGNLRTYRCSGGVEFEFSL